MAAIANTAQTQGVYVNVPAVDWSLFRELIRKFDWQADLDQNQSLRFIGCLSQPREVQNIYPFAFNAYVSL